MSMMREELHYLVDRLPEADLRPTLELVRGRLKDVPRMAELVRTYLDLPLGVVDAAVISLAERLGLDEIATLDHRHFAVVRPRHGRAFKLLPN